MKEPKGSFRISNSLVNNSTSKFQKVSYQSGSKRSFGYPNSGASVRFFTSHSLNFQGSKGITSIEDSRPAAPNMSSAKKHTSIEEMCIQCKYISRIPPPI